MLSGARKNAEEAGWLAALSNLYPSAGNSHNQRMMAGAISYDNTAWLGAQMNAASLIGADKSNMLVALLLISTLLAIK